MLSMDLFQKFLVQAALSTDDRADQVTGLGHGFAAIGVTPSQSKQIVTTRAESSGPALSRHLHLGPGAASPLFTLT